MSETLLLGEEVYRLVGAAMTVYNAKGYGFVEPVYQDCLEIELAHLAIPFDAQKNIALSYRGQILRHTYTPDLVCFDTILLELKAVKELADEHRAQVINYLKATGLPLGLLVNFGCRNGLQWERIILSKTTT
jgi:GxxExxY protein